MALKINNKNVLTLNNNPHSLIAEEFENIRFNVEFLLYENTCRTILITSPSAKEGKSTTSANLAIALARSGKKVLLIDSHIKNPNIHQLFKIKNSIGLTNILSGQKTMGESVNQTDIETLKVLTSGPIPYNTEKLFRSIAWEELLKHSLIHFDYVLIDSPPVLDSSDTSVIANKCDGVLMVIRNGKTEDSAALEAKQSLQLTRAKLLGVILNRKRRKLFKKDVVTFNV